jgi:hypothetical protein
MAMAVISMNGEAITSSTKEHTTSMQRLAMRCSTERLYSRVRSKGLSNTCSSSAPIRITSVIFGSKYTRMDWP